MARMCYQFPGEHVYDGMTLPSHSPADILDRIKASFHLRDDDVLLVSYPKTGTTWVCEILWLIKNYADVEQASAKLQDDRVPYLEFDIGKDPLSIDNLEGMTTPRLFKSHLPYRFFKQELKQKKTKVVLTTRNIRDTLVSFYHFYRMNSFLGNMTGSFEDFFTLFKEKHLAYGDWFDHLIGYLDNMEHINLLVFKYEDLHKDLKGNIRKLAYFLDEELNVEQVDRIAELVDFKVMQSNVSVNKAGMPELNQAISPFFRKGVVGDWKNYFTEEHMKYIDAIYKEKIERSGLDFSYEL